MSSDTPAAATIYGPGRRAVGWGLPVVIGLPAPMLLVFAWTPFRFWRDYNDASALPFAIGIAAAALVFLALAVLMRRLPLTPAVITVSSEGLRIETSGLFAQPAVVLCWHDIAAIELTPSSSAQSTTVDLTPGQGRRRIRLLNYQLGVPLIEMLRDIANRAEAAGYRFDGGPMQDPWLFRRRWTLRPR